MELLSSTLPVTTRALLASASDRPDRPATLDEGSALVVGLPSFVDEGRDSSVLMTVLSVSALVTVGDACRYVTLDLGNATFDADGAPRQDKASELASVAFDIASWSQSPVGAEIELEAAALASALPVTHRPDTSTSPRPGAPDTCACGNPWPHDERGQRS